MNVLTLGITTLGGLAALWVFGGPLARVGGLLLVLVGGFDVGLQHSAGGVLVLAIGALLWLAGHWHYALRHQTYKSPLARHLFCRWAPAWLDSTRGWAVGVSEESADRWPAQRRRVG